jgi:hypothetical protein
MAFEYIKHKQKQLERKRQREAKLKAEEEERLLAEAEAKARELEEIAEGKRLLAERQESERLHHQRVQVQQEMLSHKWDKQLDALLADVNRLEEEDNRLEEIRVIIGKREPIIQELDWNSWLLSDPLNQRLADLDLERALEMFKRDNLLAYRRKPTRGRKKFQNYALSFSGDRAGATDSYATTTFNPDTYSLWNGFTISFWVRPDEAMNQTSVILGSKANSPTARFHFGIHSNGNINVGIGGTNVTGISNPMEVGQWYNWVLTYTGDDKGAGERKVRMWINNDPRMTSNTNTRWANQDEGMTIYFGGRNIDTSGYSLGFACALTNVAIYNVCKDSDGTFANQVYNNGIKHNYNGSDDLVGYWRFSEGRGITIADTSGNGNNGTFGAISGQTTAYPIWEKL